MRQVTPSQATDAKAVVSPTRNVQEYRNKLKKKKKGNFECYILNPSPSDAESILGLRQHGQSISYGLRLPLTG